MLPSLNIVDLFYLMISFSKRKLFGPVSDWVIGTSNIPTNIADQIAGEKIVCSYISIFQ